MGILSNLGSTFGSRLIHEGFNAFGRRRDRKNTATSLEELQRLAPELQRLTQQQAFNNQAMIGGADPSTLPAFQLPQFDERLFSNPRLGNAMMEQILKLSEGGGLEGLGRIEEFSQKQGIRTRGGVFDDISRQGSHNLALEGASNLQNPDFRVDPNQVQQSAQNQSVASKAGTFASNQQNNDARVALENLKQGNRQSLKAEQGAGSEKPLTFGNKMSLERIADKRATEEAISQIINSPDFNTKDDIGIDLSPSNLQKRAQNSPGFKKIKAPLKKALLSSIQASLKEGFGVGGGQQQLPENPSLLSPQTVLSPKILKQLSVINKQSKAKFSKEQRQQLLSKELMEHGVPEQDIPAIVARIIEG